MIKTQALFRIDVELAPFQDIGEVPGGYRRVIPITGGKFTGERLSGKILPGGADWNLVRPDGTVHVWARYTLQADDGTLIMITNEGVQPGDPETMAKLLAGEPVDMDSLYGRTQPVFEVAGAKYAFLNQRMFVGNLTPTGPLSVSIDVDEIL